MCGRITLSTPAAKLIELFQLTAFPRMAPGYNIAPTQLVLCVRKQEGRQHAVFKQWGLVPPWAKDTSIGNKMINARSETAAVKPAFRKAWSARRCLIPVDGFYEWEKLSGRRKQPWRIHMPDRVAFSIGGLWESWQPTISGNAAPLETCTILTTSANADMSPIHDRMPVVIPREHHDTWLNEATEQDHLKTLTQPLPNGLLQRYPVSTLVNKPSNNSADCLAAKPGNDHRDLQQRSLFEQEDDCESR